MKIEKITLQNFALKKHTLRKRLKASYEIKSCVCHFSSMQFVRSAARVCAQPRVRKVVAAAAFAMGGGTAVVAVCEGGSWWSSLWGSAPAKPKDATKPPRLHFLEELPILDKNVKSYAPEVRFFSCFVCDLSHASLRKILKCSGSPSVQPPRACACDCRPQHYCEGVEHDPWRWQVSILDV